MANVVLLMSDEHNPAFASVYGHPFIQTPSMARLADSGVVFENAYCGSPLCLPSRSAFMAGRRVHELQTYSNCNVDLDRSHPSYGAVLREQGVYTAYIGKTDVYDRGDTLGFCEMTLPGDRALPGDTNHSRRPLAIRKGSARRANGFGPRQDAGAADRRCVDAAIEWLGTKAPSLNAPWFLTVNVTSPHFPHYTDPSLWEMAADGDALPEYGPDCASANHAYARDLRDHFETDEFSERQIRGLRRGYLGCVMFVDQQLGRLINVLEQTGQRDSTNVIYTSDHGEMLGKFGMWWKCSLYEDAVRIPCIAAGPDFQRGMRVHTTVDLHDVRAAAFSALGAKQPPGWLGVALQHLDPRDDERVVFSEYHGHGTRASSYMVRQGRWKYLHYTGAPHQLFDLEADPNELRNLCAVRPDVGMRLEGELRAICSPEEEDARAEEFILRQLAVLDTNGQ
jgi:choline-sulfatase